MPGIGCSALAPCSPSSLLLPLPRSSITSVWGLKREASGARGWLRSEQPQPAPPASPPLGGAAPNRVGRSLKGCGSAAPCDAPSSTESCLREQRGAGHRGRAELSRSRPAAVPQHAPRSARRLNASDSGTPPAQPPGAGQGEASFGAKDSRTAAHGPPSPPAAPPTPARWDTELRSPRCVAMDGRAAGGRGRTRSGGAGAGSRIFFSHPPAQVPSRHHLGSQCSL